ncbi:MAG: DUF892 family protein [Gemmatimonadota bacterium]
MPTREAEAISSYVTDMLALEQHIQKALRGQISDLESDYPAIVAELRSIETTTQRHISALEALAEQRQGTGQDVAESVKRIGSALLGFGAAAIDFLRTEKLPKNLRDDYTACSLASVGYVMLHTTALSLGDTEAAELAHRHLRGHARSTMTLHNVIPQAVVQFLQSDGLPARADVLREVARNIEAVWKDESGVPSADDISTGSSRSWQTAQVGDRGSIPERGL